jgi:hypothetical protein
MDNTNDIQITMARADSLHSVVQGRANPKRLAELAEMLAELRDWAWLEAKVETEKPKQEIWLQVRDWAEGAAAQKKLNLAGIQTRQEGARVPKATPDANGGARLETRVSAGGVESLNS